MDRTQKQEFVASFKEEIADKQLVVVTKNTGLTVEEVSAFRSKVREAQASYKVTKNRLTRLAFEDTNFAVLNDLLKGPTGLSFSSDPVGAAKAVINYAKENEKLEVVGGSLNGELLDANGVKALASLPSLDELRGKIVGVISAPARNIAVVANAPASQLARVFGAYGSSN